MEYFNKLINKQDYHLVYRQELFEMIIYIVVSFFLPFLIGHPQVIVGVVVNALLITSALNVKGVKLLPVIIAPSLGALSRGILFGPFTIFLIYMIPSIWIGNSIIVYCFKYFNLYKKLNYTLTLIIGSLLKAGFLFAIAYLLVSMKILPTLFLTTMGLFQLYTAIAGGILAFGFQKAKKTLG